MGERRDIQRQHERAVVAGFLVWLRNHRKANFTVVAEPNPPEAIIKSPRRSSWVEVVDVFWTDEWAKDLYSDATPGENMLP